MMMIGISVDDLYKRMECSANEVWELTLQPGMEPAT
jgi:hypothetical protein